MDEEQEITCSQVQRFAAFPRELQRFLLYTVAPWAESYHAAHPDATEDEFVEAFKASELFPLGCAIAAEAAKKA